MARAINPSRSPIHLLSTCLLIMFVGASIASCASPKQAAVPVANRFQRQIVSDELATGLTGTGTSFNSLYTRGNGYTNGYGSSLGYDSYPYQQQQQSVLGYDDPLYNGINSYDQTSYNQYNKYADRSPYAGYGGVGVGGGGSIGTGGLGGLSGGGSISGLGGGASGGSWRGFGVGAYGRNGLNNRNKFGVKY